MEVYDIQSHSIGPTRGFVVPFKQGNGALLKRIMNEHHVRFNTPTQIVLTYLDDTDEERITEFYDVKTVVLWDLNKSLEITTKIGYWTMVYRIHKDDIINIEEK